LEGGGFGGDSQRRSRKVRLALRLRAETAATIKWIAQRLQMGSWTRESSAILAPEEIEMTADGKYYKTRNPFQHYE
jgi:hypothetical protein